MEDYRVTTIERFPLRRVEEQEIEIPYYQLFMKLDVDINAENVFMWCGINPSNHSRKVKILMRVDGQPIGHVGTYLGTVRCGASFWHFFTGPEESWVKQDGWHYSTHYLVDVREAQ